jgi:hypothetical protein
MLTSEKLIEKAIYTRNELRQKFSIRDSTINNGVFRPAGHQSIWLFVTRQKTKDRPQLVDYLDDDILYWDGQPKGGTDSQIIEHEASGLELLVFYREYRNEFPNFGFRYEGHFRYISHTGSQPAHFILRRVTPLLEIVKKDTEALKIMEAPAEYYIEGKSISRLVNTHERNPKLRTEAIKIHGTRCQACGFSFGETYGQHGVNFIEVHHLRPVAQYSGETVVDPLKDMTTVCSNCHRMIHRDPDHPLSLEELCEIIRVNQAIKERNSN